MALYIPCLGERKDGLCLCAFLAERAKVAELLAACRKLLVGLEDHHNGTNTLRPFAATFDRDERTIANARAAIAKCS